MTPSCLPGDCALASRAMNVLPASAPVAPPEAAHICAVLPALVGQKWHPLEGGRVNRVWRVGALVVKQHRPAAASPLFPNDATIEYAMLEALRGTGLAPTPVAGGADWLAYRFAVGQTWQSGAAGVGALLARLHATPAPQLSLRRTASGSVALLAELRQWPRLRNLPPLPEVAVTEPAPARLLHGDPVAGNILVRGGNALLIDWQCPALGDPVDDVALFLSPGMQHLYRGYPLSTAEVAAFREGYADAGVLARYDRLAPLLHWRIAAHCALRAGQDHPGYALAFDLECQAFLGKRHDLPSR